MAYVGHRTWWLEGPRKRCGFGQIAPSAATATSGTCLDGTAPSPLSGCDDGSTPTCPSGSTFNGIQCSTASLLVGNPLLPVGSSATIIPGVANQYVLIGGGVLALFLLMAVKK